jgi:hypothetical protein
MSAPKIIEPPRHECGLPEGLPAGSTAKWKCPVCGSKWRIFYGGANGELPSGHSGSGPSWRWRRREIKRLREQVSS